MIILNLIQYSVLNITYMTEIKLVNHYLSNGLALNDSITILNAMINILKYFNTNNMHIIL